MKKIGKDTDFLGLTLQWANHLLSSKELQAFCYNFLFENTNLNDSLVSHRKCIGQTRMLIFPWPNPLSLTPDGAELLEQHFSS